VTQPAPFPPDPERAVQRARTAAQRALVLRLHAAGWGRWCPGVVGPLAAVLAEIAVDAAFPVFKHEISARQRPEGGP
jgi:hypothetical protein